MRNIQKIHKFMPLMLLGMIIIIVMYHMHSSSLSVKSVYKQWAPPFTELTEETVQKPHLGNLGVLASRNAKGWFSRNCDGTRKLRSVSFPTDVGNLTFYIYDSAAEDNTFTRMALNGYYVERMLMAKFVNLSRDLPLIDVGGNLGIVTLQAALQGRQVVAVEPIPENALRLCRAVVDFGHAHLVHVMQNAASSQEGNVTLAMDRPKGRARYGVIRSETWGYEQTAAYAIHLDRLLELIPFRTAALKIDVESHEGHVLAGAERLFQEVDIPIVWMEWEHVKRRPEYGGAFIIQFMQRHNLVPCDLMSGLRLPTENYRNWPRTVLWLKDK